MKESEIDENDQIMYGDGDILQELAIQNDEVCQLSLVHTDHVYCVTQLPLPPFNTFLSGDGNNKCYLWTIKPKASESNEKAYECIKI